MHWIWRSIALVGVNIELENLKSTYDIKVLSLKKFLYAAGRSLMTEVSVSNDRG